jgi:hypothetical protein
VVELSALEVRQEDLRRLGKGETRPHKQNINEKAGA